MIVSLFPGGDLHYHLTQHGVFSEDEVSVRVMHCVSSCSQHLCTLYNIPIGIRMYAHVLQIKFYAAELTLSLEHIHSQNIVYRDLKVSESGFVQCK